MKADLVLYNCSIITMNPSAPRAEAVAVREGKIVYVGTGSGVKRWVGGKTKIIDLKSKTVVPGFTDSHAHLISLGHPFPWLDLRYVPSIKEIQNRVKAKAQETGKGKWILGRGWDQDRLEEKRFPTRWDLDRASPDNPVLLTRVCGHVAVANSRALQMAKISKKTAVCSSEFVDTAPRTSEPTGLLKEKAVDLVSNLLEPREEELLNACCKASADAVRVGLTSVTCITNESDEIYVLQKLRKQGQLPLRVYTMFPAECLDSFKGEQLNDPFLKLRCIKIFTDGSLGARTAAMQKPYTDDPSTSGILYHSLGQLKNLIKEADQAGFQVAVHAIGDKAVEETLKAFSEALSKERITRHRHRIEHASVLNPNLIKRIKALGLAVCIQPHFIVSDFWVPQRLGPERARWTYALKSLVSHGVRLAASSDAPVEPLSPLLGIWAAVTQHEFLEERLSAEEALKTYTVDAAYFSFEENVKGSIEVGKYADFTVLSHNPLKVKPEKIKDIRVEMTVVEGKVVYSASG